MKFIKILIVICFLLITCAPASLHVQLKYIPEKNLSKAVSIEGGKANLRITKIDIFDERADQEGLGLGSVGDREILGQVSAGGVPIYITGVIDWIRNGIVSLSELGYSFPSLDEERKASGLSLKVNIKRVSCQRTMAYMRYTVLTEVGFYADGVLIQKKLYYGTHLDGQVLGRLDEEDVLEGVNKALAQFLVKFESDLREIANGQKPM